MKTAKTETPDQIAAALKRDTAQIHKAALRIAGRLYPLPLPPVVEETIAWTGSVLSDLKEEARMKAKGYTRVSRGGRPL